MRFSKEGAVSVLLVVMGALSFLMLLPGFAWWAGLACAFAAIILGRRSMRRPGRFGQIAGVCAVVLSVLGTGAFLIRALP